MRHEFLLTNGPWHEARRELPDGSFGDFGGKIRVPRDATVTVGGRQVSSRGQLLDWMNGLDLWFGLLTVVVEADDGNATSASFSWRANPVALLLAREGAALSRAEDNVLSGTRRQRR